MNLNAIVLLFGLLSVSCLPASAARRMTLTEAIAGKTISVSMSSLSPMPDSLRIQGGHALVLSITSLIHEPLDLITESGQRFQSLDSSYQNLMILETRVISMKPKEKKKLVLNGFCINKHRGSPSGNAYRIGKLASGVLLKVANFLGKNRIYRETAQQAVWSITDNSSIENVTGTSNSQTRMVRSFLYETTGRARPPRETAPLSYPNVALKGNIRWTMPADQKVTLAVVDPQGKVIGYLFREYAFKTGSQTYQFEFMDDALVPEEMYKIQVLSGTTVLSEYAVKSREEKGGG